MVDDTLRAWFTGYVSGRTRPRSNAARGVVWQTRSKQPDLVAGLSGLLTSIGVEHHCNETSVRVTSRAGIATIARTLLLWHLLPEGDARAWSAYCE